MTSGICRSGRLQTIEGRFQTGIFLILIFAASLAFKVSFQRNLSSRPRQKLSSRRLPISLTLIGAISSSAVCVVDIVILVVLRRAWRDSAQFYRILILVRKRGIEIQMNEFGQGADTGNEFL